MSFTPDICKTLTFVPFAMFSPSWLAADHTCPWTLTCPAESRLLISSVTIPSSPISASAFVFTSFLLNRHFAIGFVRTSIRREIRIKPAVCTKKEPPSAAANAAPKAPAANQKVVSPTERIPKKTRIPPAITHNNSGLKDAALILSPPFIFNMIKNFFLNKKKEAFASLLYRYINYLWTVCYVIIFFFLSRISIILQQQIFFLRRAFSTI